MTDVVMPQMGESITEGTLTRWLKKPGEKLERDEPLFEISTDKVDTEIPAPVAGVLSEILVQEGTTVSINTIVGRIGDGAHPRRQQPLRQLLRRKSQSLLRLHLQPGWDRPLRRLRTGPLRRLHRKRRPRRLLRLLP